MSPASAQRACAEHAAHALPQNTLLPCSVPPAPAAQLGLAGVTAAPSQPVHVELQPSPARPSHHVQSIDFYNV